MSLITLNGVSFDFAGEPLLRSVSFSVERGERWGVLGRNGTGKTTLFRLIAGSLEPTAGSISRESGLRITLLDQHRVFDGAATVWEAAAMPFAHLIALEQSLQDQAHGLESDASPGALARYDRDLQRFEREGGHTYRATVDAVLEGVGFHADSARTQRLEGLSGGERGRVGLARQLMAIGDILLLDEPTNHLDLETTQWLEGFLIACDAAVMVVSHDRVFLDRVIDRTLHIEDRTASPYSVGYADFVRMRTERREAQQKAYELQRRKIDAEEDFIRRNIAGQKTRQAQGRRKRLARLPRLSPPPTERGSALAMRLWTAERGGDQVVVARDVRIDMGARTLVDGFSSRVERGDIIGMVGPNGTGKSTLLKAIAGEREITAGTITVGAGITIEHYRQDLAQVPADKSLFDAVHDLRPEWNRGGVQAHLGRFAFSGDEVLRIAGTLSGGEQARLALAMIVLSGANLLLFDEPTNHLDVESIEALEDALTEFDGTIILVSHDRELLASLTTRTWALYDGMVEDFPGSFAEWSEARSEREGLAAAQRNQSEALEKQSQRDKARQAHAGRASAASERRAARRAVEAAEGAAHALEAEIGVLTERLHDQELYTSAQGAAEAHRLQSDLQRLRERLDVALDAWAEAEEHATALDAAD